MPFIKVIRKKQGLLGFARKFKIYVDDKKIGELAHGTDQEFELPAGKHKIYCIQDIFNTPSVHEFELNDGDSKVFIASYKKTLKFFAFFVVGIAISLFGSEMLVQLLGFDRQFWICFYVLFVLLLLVVMKKFKMFKINIAEV